MPLDQPISFSSIRTVVRGACPHDCPDTCALHVTVENGRAIKVEGDPEHPTTNVVLCTKVARYLERTYSDARVLDPLQRVGRKGEGKFRRISWDQALDTIAARFGEIAASSDGAQAILPYSYAGTMGLLQYGSMASYAFLGEDPRAQGLSWNTLKTKGWQRLNVPSPYAPFAQGNFPTPSGKCEFYSQSLADQGLDPLPTFTPPRESAASNPALAKQYPLAMLSPPARNALNSTFGNLPVFLDAEKVPSVDIHPRDAASRGIVEGEHVRAFNDRGSMILAARVTDKTRPGVVVALSIWWRKLSPDGTNANMLTGQALTDMGRAATFYDVLVEIERV